MFTPLIEKLVRHEDLTMDEATAAMREVMEANTPLKCLGTPQDIAAAALYLASPASAWVTGKVIDVDGGADSSVWPG